MPTYLKYEYIFSSFRFKVGPGSGSAFFFSAGSGSAFFPSRIRIRGKKCRILIPEFNNWTQFMETELYARFFDI